MKSWIGGGRGGIRTREWGVEDWTGGRGGDGGDTRRMFGIAEVKMEEFGREIKREFEQWEGPRQRMVEVRIDKRGRETMEGRSGQMQSIMKRRKEHK
jgi:hypothetical protein